MAVISQQFPAQQNLKQLFRQTSAQFIAHFEPPDYLIDGVLIRGFLYSLTGRTGSGKTAVVLLIALCVVLGLKIGELEVLKGTVFYFAGENPDDVRMRWIAMLDELGLDPEKIDVHFFPRRFKISEEYSALVDEAQKVGGVALVIVDTSNAYFEGNDINNNKQQIDHAMLLRTLTELPGKPCVIANCHPVKNAAADNLQPYGGGGFINEIDGNLTCALHGVAIEVHWQGKFRGAEFSPLTLRIRTVWNDKLKNKRGRLIPQVVAEHLSEAAQRDIAKAARSHADQLLAEIERDGRGSQADFAKRCSWSMQNGEPYKVLVARTLKTLKDRKLIVPDPEGDGWALTAKGKKARKKTGTTRVPDAAASDGQNNNQNKPERSAADPQQPTEKTPEQACSDFETEQTPTPHDTRNGTPPPTIGGVSLRDGGSSCGEAPPRGSPAGVANTRFRIVAEECPQDLACAKCGKAGDDKAPVKTFARVPGDEVVVLHDACMAAFDYGETESADVAAFAGRLIEPGLAQVLREWQAAFGIDREITIDTLVRGVDHLNGLKSALLAVAAMDDGLTVSNVQLARWLRGVNGVAANHLFLQYGGVNSRGSQLWTLRREILDSAP